MKRTLIALCTAALAGSAMASDTIERLPIMAGDTAASQLVAMPTAKARPHHESQAVQFTWLAKDADLSSWQAPEPTAQTSRSYWQEVKASELAQGVSVYTTAPGALIRLSAPAADKAFGTRTVEVLRDGQALREGAGIKSLASAEALKATGAPFSDGTIAFQLAPEQGSGVFQIQATHSMKSDATYLLQVHEPNSSVALNLGTDRLVAYHGGQLKVSARFAEGVALGNQQLTGFVTSPGGDLFPVSFKAGQDGSFQANVNLDMLKTSPGQPGELWEVHAVASAKLGDQPVFRDVRTAFSAAIPTAQLGDTAMVTNAGEKLMVPVGIKAASAGRYELRATLFGTDSSGQAQPIALTHSAAQLSPGESTLGLGFPMQAIASSGLGAPYSLRNVELLDQGQMALLARQQLAFEFSELPQGEQVELPSGDGQVR